MSTRPVPGMAIRSMAAAVALCAMCGPTAATERDVIPYPNGIETFGVGIIQTPGFYYFNSTQYYTADRLNNSQGKSSIPNFRVRVFANAHRFDEVWPVEVLGGNIATRVAFPLVDIDTRAGNQHQSKFGLSNASITPLVIGWHREYFHWLTGVDVNVPIARPGSWKAADLVNVYENYVQVEPHFDATFLVPNGPEADIKLMYDFNTTNRVDNYHSGQTFHMDFAAGWNFGPITAGLVGYYLTQTTDDTVLGVRVGPDGNRTRALALGPGLRYVSHNFRIQVNWKHDITANNHTKGDAFWVRFVVKL